MTTQSIENQIEYLSRDRRGLSKILPSRLTADQGQSKSPCSEAWQKLEECAQINIVSLGGGFTAIAAMAFAGSTVIATMFPLLRVVVCKVDNCIGEDAHLARLTMKADNLLGSLETILDVLEPKTVEASRNILDELAERA
ncbi:hypothetical protein F5146DRAFT_1137233 [Armillaria mellea]|nr:hypothetical protein F5146DRAFT_1137233 [Armillaria mellea]